MSGSDFGPVGQRFLAAVLIVIGGVVFLASGACTLSMAGGSSGWGWIGLAVGGVPILAGFGVMTLGIITWRNAGRRND